MEVSDFKAEYPGGMMGPDAGGTAPVRRALRGRGGMSMIVRDGDKTTVTPVGRIDTLAASQFAEEMDQALAGTREMTLDCSRLEYISSSGLKVVMQAVKTMYSQGEMRIINVTDDIYEVLSLTGFLAVCDVERQA